MNKWTAKVGLVPFLNNLYYTDILFTHPIFIFLILLYLIVAQKLVLPEYSTPLYNYIDKKLFNLSIKAFNCISLCWSLSYASAYSIIRHKMAFSILNRHVIY